MGKLLKILLAVAVPGAGGLGALLLGGGGELLEGAKDLGLAWMVKSAIEDLLGGSDVLFARFLVLASIVIMAGLVVLHIWRGDTWAGKFRASLWLWCGVGGFALVLLAYGLGDLTLSRMERANRAAARVAGELPLPKPQRDALQRQVKRSLLEQPAGRCIRWDGETSACVEREGR